VVVISRNTKKKKVTIGRYPEVTLAEAREAARTLLARSTLAAPKPKASISFSDAVALFLESYAQQHHSGQWAKEVARLLRTHCKSLNGRPLAEIETEDITRIADRLLDRPSEANHAFSVTRRFFNWAAERGYVESSPCIRLKMPSA